MPHPFDQADKVRAETLTPQQRETPPKFQRACDFRQQCLIKHPKRSEFHSLAEYLHAGLLEGNPDVEHFVPQPFLLGVNGRPYTPDCYVRSKDGVRVIELKPQAKFPDDKRIPLEQFFALRNMSFEVLGNEAVYERQVEAQNWLEIARTLFLARDIDSANEEMVLLDRLYAEDQCELGDLVDPGHREGSFLMELGLLRLLHRGQLQASLADNPLDYDTEISRCA